MAALSRPGAVTAPTTATSLVTDQLAPVLDGVVERVEAADQERGHAEIVVVEERLGDLLRRADQRGGVARPSYRRRDGRPEALVVDLGLAGEVHQALCPHRLGVGKRAV